MMKVYVSLSIILIMSLVLVVGCNNSIENPPACDKCSDLKDETACLYNECGLSCNWDVNKCIEKVEIQRSLSGEVYWIDDMTGKSYPHSETDVLVFPLSELTAFRNSIMILEKYESKYILNTDILQSYKFENTDELGKYQFELKGSGYIICFGRKTPTELQFERFYPNKCYQFEFGENPVVINYGGAQLTEANCENTICTEVTY